jgi:hypothetical protein
MMETYPVDIDPEQVVRWIKAEREAAPTTFKIAARRIREVREIPPERSAHLGDEEREDLSEIATIATLEIAPSRASDGWLLTVLVEDEMGPRVPDTGATSDDEQQIDLTAFYKEFIRSGRGNATVIAAVTDSAAKARMAHLLRAIETNRHAPARGRHE